MAPPLVRKLCTPVSSLLGDLILADGGPPICLSNIYNVSEAVSAASESDTLSRLPVGDDDI